jgi:hypothetical protein
VELADSYISSIHQSCKIYVSIADDSTVGILQDQPGHSLEHGSLKQYQYQSSDPFKFNIYLSSVHTRRCACGHCYGELFLKTLSLDYRRLPFEPSIRGRVGIGVLIV